MKKIYTTILMLSALYVMGQQEGQSHISQYTINAFLVNPAVSAEEDMAVARAGYRKQWVNIPGGPSTMYISAHSTYGKNHGAMTQKGAYHNWHGFGGLIYQHSAGALRETNSYMNYAYNLKLSKGHGFGTKHVDGLRLSMGSFVGIKSQRWDQRLLTEMHYLTANDNPESVTLDVTTAQNLTTIDGSVGMLLYLPEKFYFGLSVFQIFGSKLKTDEQLLNKHYYITAMYKAQMQQHSYIVPSFLIKSVPGAPSSIDGGLKYDYDDRFWAGINTRFGNNISVDGNQFAPNAATIYVGALIEHAHSKGLHRSHGRRYGLEVFYSFDATLSALSYASNGSHEITIGFRLPPVFRAGNAEDGW